MRDSLEGGGRPERHRVPAWHPDHAAFERWEYLEVKGKGFFRRAQEQGVEVPAWAVEGSDLVQPVNASDARGEEL